MSLSGRALPIVFCGLLVACGRGNTPVSPGTSAPPPPPVPWVVTGQVAATLSGAPVPGARVDAFFTAADADADGRFTLTHSTPPAASQAITVSADGYRARETFMRMPRAGELLVDITSTTPPFDETFYNQLARDALDEPTADYPLYRWSSALKFYLKTQDETGRPLPGSVLDVVRRGLRDGVRYFTAGAYEAVIEEGTETRAERLGYVNVLPRQKIEGGDFCGLASTIGGNPMTIELRIDACGCGSIRIPYDIVLHEVGHAVGMFHVAGKSNIMHGTADFNCREVAPSALEQHHAALIYARPRGNRSPDRDPSGFTLSEPGADLPRLPARP